MAQVGPSISQNAPWAPLVLSLDGGGVRGLSSLYILREIMRRIKELDNRDIAQNRIEQDQTLPLPCHYFDLIIGTSTGGLIAIMLGRLRMSVEDCIKEYWTLSNSIFRPHRTRFVQLYSRRKVQEAAKTVVQRYCRCHGPGEDGCSGLEDLRQYDFHETGRRVTKTCRVAVITVREKPTTVFQSGNRGEPTIMFRSYDHLPRIDTTDPRHLSEYELNPRTLDRSTLKIHEACSCTSAGPTYFRSMLLHGRKYIDGGVAANNPAVHAWNEARLMANPPGEPWDLVNFPHMLVSVGTGKPEENSRFGNISMFWWMLKHITSTETAHRDAAALVATHPSSSYFRFDVPATPDNPNHKGLSHIRMDECKKNKRRRQETISSISATRVAEQPNVDGHQPSLPPNGQANPPNHTNTLNNVQLALESDRALQKQAAERKKGGYKPHKYEYRTFDKIRERTATYCRSNDGFGNSVSERLDSCAMELRNRSLLRRNLPGGGQRWQEFRRHPDPRYQAPGPQAPAAA